MDEEERREESPDVERGDSHSRGRERSRSPPIVPPKVVKKKPPTFVTPPSSPDSVEQSEEPEPGPNPRDAHYPGSEWWCHPQARGLAATILKRVVHAGEMRPKAAAEMLYTELCIQHDGGTSILRESNWEPAKANKTLAHYDSLGRGLGVNQSWMRNDFDSIIQLFKDYYGQAATTPMIRDILSSDDPVDVLESLHRTARLLQLKGVANELKEELWKEAQAAEEKYYTMEYFGSQNMFGVSEETVWWIQETMRDKSSSTETIEDAMREVRMLRDKNAVKLWIEKNLGDATS